MDSLNLADTFVTFFALFGPQKVLLSFGRLSRTLDDHSVRTVAAATASTAAIIRGRDALGWLAKLGLPSRLVDATGVVFTVAGWPDEPVPVLSEIAQK